jgi:hypothetical protein
MKRALLSGLLLLGVLLVRAQDDHGFSRRAQRLLEVLAEEGENSPFSLVAKIRLGRDRAGAIAILDSMTRDVSMGGMFYAYSLMGAYLHTRDQLPDSMHAKVREAFRWRTMYRGDTENHWVMYYTGMYLAAQTWPGEDASRWFNGRSSTENFEEAKAWLDQWMRTASTIGQGEFDSPTYMCVFLSPMLVLYEFAADRAMKTRAQAMLDLLLADFAAEHLNGAYCGGHSRDYPDDIVNPLAAPATRVAWLYFGQPDTEKWEDARYRPRHRGSWETVFGALGSYRLPEIIYQIATDRALPYVHTETKRVRNVIRFGDVRNPPVYKYMYMTREYALGSLQGGILQPIQQHTWDVTFGTGKPNNTIFTLHPYYSWKELAMFFPEEMKFLAGEVDRYHLVYTNPDKWNSSSPFEQTLQQKNAIIVLYNIAPGEKHPHIDGFFPKNLDERETDPTGWIFCRSGESYVAFRPLKPYEWIEEKSNWRFRSHELKNGVVVEVGSASSFASYDHFKAEVRRTSLRFDDFDRRLTVDYTTTGGDRLHFTYGGRRSVNGKVLDFSSYRLFHGPFINAEVGSGIITLTHGGQKRVLDFRNSSIVDE